MNLWRNLAIVEALGIIALSFILIGSFSDSNPTLEEESEEGLLSQRLSTGVLAPKSMLIFNFNSLEKEIEDYTLENNLNISMYVLNIRDGASFGMDEDKSFEAFSLNKLPVAIITLMKVEEGKISLDDKLPISYRDRQAGVGSGTLYSEQISELSIRELLKRMLQESDNTAFSVLAEDISFEEGIQLSDYLDFYQSDIEHLKTPTSLKITPKKTANLFISLYLSTILEPENSELILSYLTNTSFDIKKYAFLPEDVQVAQKYGSFYYQSQEFFHSCGLMYIEDSRIFYCIMTEGTDKENAKKAVGAIVNKIYTFVTESKKSPDYL